MIYQELEPPEIAATEMKEDLTQDQQEEGRNQNKVQAADAQNLPNHVNVALKDQGTAPEI